MDKLPLRFRILKEIMITEKGHNIKTVMNSLKGEYGNERQFSEPVFLDHLLSLKESLLIDEKEIMVDKKENLLVTYEINDEGRKTLRKYLPKGHS